MPGSADPSKFRLALSRQHVNANSDGGDQVLLSAGRLEVVVRRSKYEVMSYVKDLAFSSRVPRLRPSIPSVLNREEAAAAIGAAMKITWSTTMRREVP